MKMRSVFAAKANPMKRIASAALLAAGATAVSLPAAGAATVSGTYYEDTAERSCPGSAANFCDVDLAQFPSSTSGMFVTLTEISCVVSTTSTFTGLTLLVTDAGANQRRPHYAPPSNPPATGLSFIREPISFKIAGGPPRQPRARVLMANPGAVSASCTIVGTISSE